LANGHIHSDPDVERHVRERHVWDGFGGVTMAFGQIRFSVRRSWGVAPGYDEMRPSAKKDVRREILLGLAAGIAGCNKSPTFCRTVSPGTSKPTSCGHFKTDSRVNVQYDVTTLSGNGK
jgi:hypothetical protein